MFLLATGFGRSLFPSNRTHQKLPAAGALRDGLLLSKTAHSTGWNYGKWEFLHAGYSDPAPAAVVVRKRQVKTRLLEREYGIYRIPPGPCPAALKIVSNHLGRVFVKREHGTCGPE